MKKVMIKGHYSKISNMNMKKAIDLWEDNHSSADNIVIEVNTKDLYSAIAVYKESVERLIVEPTEESEIKEDPLSN